MRQLRLTIEDDLYQRLHDRADTTGQSMDDLIASILRADDRGSTHAAFKERVRAAGLAVEWIPQGPRLPPLSNDEIDELSAPFGTSVSEALEADRDGR